MTSSEHSTKSLSSKEEKLQALGESIQILPFKKEEKSGIVLAEVTKERPSKGKVLSVGEGRYLADGTFIKPNVEVGDIVVYNPHMVSYEYETDEGTSVIISSTAIYGKII